MDARPTPRLRRQEGCQQRVHDLDLVWHQFTVRHGKGGKDRVVMLPRSLRAELERHLAQRRQEHNRDLAEGQAYAPLAFATEDEKRRFWLRACPFLKAIVVQHPDQMPRLIFADWLDEQGCSAASAMEPVVRVVKTSVVLLT
jgi:uncharacterized protein (TIGR02996 family)